MRVRFSSLAEQEMRDAFAWYEEQSPGLGHAFLAELDQAITRIRRYPESCPANKDQVRRLLIHRFPYALWYVIEGDALLVYAVAHLHREPRYWIERCQDT